MKRMLSQWVVLAVVLLGTTGWAVIEKGEVVPNQCWTTLDGGTFCLDDAKDTVRVLIHNAGWCGPCNAEMKELAPLTKAYEGKPVTFVSLSINGWTHGSAPTPQFLKEWQQKYQIPFTVAASPKDPGKAFFEPPLYIPNVVVIDKSGSLVYKDFAPPVSTLLQEVDAALNH